MGEPVAGRVGATACVLGGVAWAGLVPASLLARADELSYDGYHRVLAVALLLFVAGFAGFALTWRPDELRARAGLGLTLGGLALVFAGETLRYWGGSDAGSALFPLGFVALFVGGPTAAAGLWRERRHPRWVGVLILLLGLGVLSGTALQEAPPLATLPVFGAFAVGWIALGRGVREAMP